MIPYQLKENKELRYLRLQPNKKNPIGINWQQPFSQSNYTYEELIKTIQPEEGIGLLCGTGKPQILVIDSDKKSPSFHILQELIEKQLPNTLRIRTPHGGIHNYFYVDTAHLPNKKTYLPLNDSAGEIRGAFCNVGIPPSKINENQYVVHNDVAIAQTKLENILTALSEFLPDKLKHEHETTNLYKIEKIIDLSRLTKRGDEYSGSHPLHGSEGGQNFWVNPDKGVWHCFRHDTGGNAITWCAVKHGLIKCEDAQSKALTGKLFVQAAEIYEKETGEKILVEKDFYNQVHNIASFESIANKIVYDLGIYYDDAQMWWLWSPNDYMWKMVDDTDIMNLIDSAIKFQTSTLESKVKGIILEGLKREGRKNKPKELSPDQIQFKNKIIDMNTNIVTDVTKEYFAVNPIPWGLAETSNTPVMDKLFSEWVDDKKELLYETIAFAIVQKYFIHRIICLTGSGRNGKSQFLTIMRRFLGSNNITSSDLELLHESRFEAAKLYRKLVCFMGETNFSIIKKTSMVKRLTGQDLIGIEFKGKKPFDIESYAKLFIASNSLPETLDKTEGFYRRWLIVDFSHKFEENGDIVDTIPEQEYSALATKCIKKLRELKKRYSFSGEGTVNDRKKNYEAKANPLSNYIAKKFVKDINYDIPFFEFFEGFVSHLESNGLRVMSKRTVSDALDQLGYETVKKHPDGDQSKTWVYIVGLKQKDTEEAEDTQSSLHSLIER